jgi:CheY-like chemotaxis protein
VEVDAMRDDRKERAAASGAPLDEEIWREATTLERVLVVSGTLRVRATLGEVLEEIGYRVRAAATAEDAWQVTRAEVPDVAIVDLTLVDAATAGSGPRIRAAAFPRRVPVLALTSDPLPDVTLRSWGIDRAIAVPLRVEELVLALQQLVEGARRVPAAGSPRWAQASMNLQDRLEARHLALATTFHARIAFDVIPQNDPYIAELRAQLAQMGIPAEAQLRDQELVVSCHPTIAEAFALGMNRFAREELFFALVDAYPELGADPDGLRRRIHELEDEYMRVQRRAS